MPVPVADTVRQRTQPRSCPGRRKSGAAARAGRHRRAHARAHHQPSGGERNDVARRNADRGHLDHLARLQHPGRQRRRRGRPDLVGADASGPRLICEAKFDAALTAAQTDTAYLDQLAPGQSGVLLFLLPEERIPALWLKLWAGPGGGTAACARGGVAEAVPGVRSAALSGGRTLACISWARLLENLGQAVELAGDARGRGDLAQLAGLVPGAADAAGCRCSRATCLTPSAVSSPASARLSCPRRVQCPSRRSAMAPAAQGRDAGSRHRAGGGSGRASGSRVGTGGGYGPVWATVAAKSESSFVALTEALTPLEHGGGPAASAPGRSPGASRSASRRAPNGTKPTRAWLPSS